MQCQNSIVLSIIQSHAVWLYFTFKKKKKDNKTIAWQQLARLSWSIVVHKLFSRFWWAVQCEQLCRAVSWVQWSGCIHLRNMKSVHIMGWSVSTPCKMCSEPWASSALRKSACKRSSSTRGLLSTYPFQLDMKIVRGLAVLTPYFYSSHGVVDKLLMFWCSRCRYHQFSVVTNNNHCDVLIEFTHFCCF